MIRYFRILATQNIWIQLLFFGILTAGSMILFTFTGQLISILAYGFPAYREAMQLLASPTETEEIATLSPSLIPVLAISQITSQIGLFVIPPILFMVLLRGSRAYSSLALTDIPKAYTLLMTFAMIVLVLPLIAWLTGINMAIPLPLALERAEENANAIVRIFFNDSGTGRFILNLCMVAIIPAIGEELFFRGVIQSYLIKGFRNVHLGVFVAAILFSFFHFQFHGFIPRLLLGLLFGYLMVWSGNLWVPVLAHFFNNGAAVVIEFLNRRGLLGTGYEEFGHDTEGLAVVLSAIFTATICFFIWYYEQQKRSDHTADFQK